MTLCLETKTFIDQRFARYVNLPLAFTYRPLQRRRNSRYCEDPVVDCREQENQNKRIFHNNSTRWCKSFETFPCLTSFPSHVLPTSKEARPFSMRTSQMYSNLHSSDANIQVCTVLLDCNEKLLPFGLLIPNMQLVACQIVLTLSYRVLDMRKISKSQGSQQCLKI